MNDNVERLKDAGVLETSASLSESELTAINNLSTEEIGFLITVRKKIKDELHLEMLISPPTHHH
jgi:hypothetical protein